jgi:hypothetical protein
MKINIKILKVALYKLVKSQKMNCSFLTFMILIFISFQCFADIFATFNLKLENQSNSEIKVKCNSLNSLSKVYFYNGKNWDEDKTKTVTIAPNKTKFFYGGTNCIKVKYFWLTFYQYISKMAKFSVTITGADSNTSLILNWKGDDGKENPKQHHIPYYYYHYTGCFLFSSYIITSKDKTKWNEPNFDVYGSSEYNSSKYNRIKILTSDNLWDSESGYYSLIVTNRDIGNDKHKFLLYKSKSKENMK